MGAASPGDWRIDAAGVIARRRAERDSLLDLAGAFVARLDPALGVRAAVVVGSVARGDFNRWSDVDVLVVADHLPPRLLDRLDRLAPRPPRVEPHPWTPDEWRRRLDRSDPMALEAVAQGVWLAGSPADLRP